jgi:hypothetical protein
LPRCPAIPRGNLSPFPSRTPDAIARNQATAAEAVMAEGGWERGAEACDSPLVVQSVGPVTGDGA